MDENGKENPISKMIISILGIVAEMERKQIKESKSNINNSKRATPFFGLNKTAKLKTTSPLVGGDRRQKTGGSAEITTGWAAR